MTHCHRYLYRPTSKRLTAKELAKHLASEAIQRYDKQAHGDDWQIDDTQNLGMEYHVHVYGLAIHGEFRSPFHCICIFVLVGDEWNVRVLPVIKCDLIRIVKAEESCPVRVPRARARAIAS